MMHGKPVKTSSCLLPFILFGRNGFQLIIWFGVFTIRFDAPSGLCIQILGLLNNGVVRSEMGNLGMLVEYPFSLCNSKFEFEDFKPRAAPLLAMVP